MIAMTPNTLRILHNVPDKLVQDLQALWRSGNVDLSHKIYGDQYQEYIQCKKPHEAYDLLWEWFNVDLQLTWMVNPPHSGLGPIHTDSNRPGCINFPIQVDLENSCFCVANHRLGEPTVRAPHEGEQINGSALRFEYEPEIYHWYNIRKPIFFSTKAAHSAYNHSDKERVLLSVSFPNMDDLNNIERVIPKEWF